MRGYSKFLTALFVCALCGAFLAGCSGQSASSSASSASASATASASAASGASTEDLIKELEGLLSHAGVRLVYIISRHNAHGTDTREDRTDFVRNLIRETGLPFTETALTLDFDQPLESKEEAKEFVDFTYLGKHAQRYVEFVEESGDDGYPFVFRNRKNLTVFAVDKRRR